MPTTLSYHVVKFTRGYNGFGYRGPSMQRADLGTDVAEFETIDQAVYAAEELDKVNPIGWEVYCKGKMVYSTISNRKLEDAYR